MEGGGHSSFVMKNDALLEREEEFVVKEEARPTR